MTRFAAPFFLLLILIHAGCVAPAEAPLVGPQSTIRDTALARTIDAVDFFVLTKIDGKEVLDSATYSHNRNYLRGPGLEPNFLDHQVQAGRPIQCTIEGRTHTGAPIGALFVKTYQIAGEVSFTPEEDHIYAIRGVLSREYSAVWIEDTSAQQIVGTKIEKRSAESAEKKSS